MRTLELLKSDLGRSPARNSWNVERSVSNEECSRKGFTMIELIGVLAIIAIAAVIVVPSFVRRADMAAQTRETSDLSTISDALVHSTLKYQRLPDETTWTNAAASWLLMSTRQIATTPRGYHRIFLVDSGGWLGMFFPGSPFTQGISGAGAAPTQARAMLVSTVSGSLPINSGRLTSAQFDAIWNLAPNAKPVTWTNWSGKGDDLLVQRLNFQPLFHRLILVNHDDASAAKVSIGAIAPMNVTQGTGSASNIWDRWYLDGTTVGLCDSSGTAMMKFQLTNDVSFVFEGSIWQDHIGGGGGDSSLAMAQNFANLSAKFLSAQWYPGSNHPGRGNQQGALTGMFDFMLMFSMWANQYPHYPKHGATAQQVPEYQLLDALINNNSPGAPGGSGYLDLFTGAGGLLNN
jgi:prepilin-type N-terminal cleavage/methylation domain-containing protein